MQAQPKQTPGSSVFDGLRLTRQGNRVEITYPSRIFPAATACALARSHGLEARDLLNGCWTVSDLIPTGVWPGRLMSYFAELNAFPTVYPRLIGTALTGPPCVSCIVVVNENLPFVESQFLPSLVANSRGHAIEVILVSNGSSGDGAFTMPVKHVRSDWGCVAAAYNRGAAVAEGDYLAIFHDDCIVDDPQWIEKCMAAIRDGATAAAGEYRHVDVIGGVNIPRLQIAKSVPLFLRRQDFLDIGRYDEFHYVGYEDLDFTLALLQRGAKLAYPAIRLRHFNGMSSTLKYCPSEGLDQLYALAAVPRGAVRQRFTEFTRRGIVRDGVDYLRLALDVQLLYILKKYREYLYDIDAASYRAATNALEREIVTRSPVDATKVVGLFRELDRILFVRSGASA